MAVVNNYLETQDENSTIDLQAIRDKYQAPWDPMGCPEDNYVLPYIPLTFHKDMIKSWDNKLHPGKTESTPLGILIRFAAGTDDRSQTGTISALKTKIGKMGIKGKGALGLQIHKVGERSGIYNVRFDLPETLQQSQQLGSVIAAVATDTLDVSTSTKQKLRLHTTPLAKDMDESRITYGVNLRFTNLDDNNNPLRTLERDMAIHQPTLLGARLSPWMLYKYHAEGGDLRKSNTAEASFSAHVVMDLILKKVKAVNSSEPTRHEIQLIDLAEPKPLYCTLCHKWGRHQLEEMGLTICKSRGHCQGCLQPLDPRESYAHKDTCTASQSFNCVPCKNKGKEYNHKPGNLLDCPLALPAFRYEILRRRKIQRNFNVRFAAQLERNIRKQGFDPMAWLDEQDTTTQRMDTSLTFTPATWDQN